MTRCIGACKRPHTKDFTPETVAIPLEASPFAIGGIRYGIVFMLHDTVECPDRIRWRMKSLQHAAQALRSK